MKIKSLDKTAKGYNRKLGSRKNTIWKKVVKAGRLIKKSNIELSMYYIVGLGGTELSKNHAINSGTLLNDIIPDFIRPKTLLLLKGTPMYKLYKESEFQLLDAHEALRETRLFVETLDSINGYFLSNHKSNCCKSNGKFPEDKEKTLKEPDYALSLDKSSFRSPTSGML